MLGRALLTDGAGFIACNLGEKLFEIVYEVICVDDVVNTMLVFMKTDKGITGPINLGNPEEISILMLYI